MRRVVAPITYTFHFRKWVRRQRGAIVPVNKAIKSIGYTMLDAISHARIKYPGSVWELCQAWPTHPQPRREVR